MEHNPESVLAIGEVALFIIGIILSLILLGILLIPSLLRFQVPHWVRVRVRPEDRSELWTGLISALQKRGYRLLEVLDHESINGAGEERVILTKDQATLYYITLAPVSLQDDEGARDDVLTLSMFRQGDEVTESGPASILSGAGIGWITILCHEYFVDQQSSRELQPEWGWDERLERSGDRPFGALMYQMLLLNPWR